MNGCGGSQTPIVRQKHSQLRQDKGSGDNAIDHILLSLVLQRAEWSAHA